MKIHVVGKDGTNGPLKKGETYDVVRIDSNELSLRSTFGYAIRPYIVITWDGTEYAPFLGKVEPIKDNEDQK